MCKVFSVFNVDFVLYLWPYAACLFNLCFIVETTNISAHKE